MDSMEIILGCFFILGLWSTNAAPLKSNSLSDLLMMPVDHDLTPVQQGDSVAKDYEGDYYDDPGESKLRKVGGMEIGQAEASRRLLFRHRKCKGKNCLRHKNSIKRRHSAFKHLHKTRGRYNDRMKRGMIGRSGQVEEARRTRRELPDPAVATDTDLLSDTQTRVERHWPIFRSTTRKSRTYTTPEYVCGSTACRSDGRRSNQGRDYPFQRRPLSRSSEEYICGSVGCRSNSYLQAREKARFQLDPTQARVLGSARMHRDADTEDQPGDAKQEAPIQTEVGDADTEEAEDDTLVSLDNKRTAESGAVSTGEAEDEVQEDDMQPEFPKKIRQSDSSMLSEDVPVEMPLPIVGPNPVQPAAAMTFETKKESQSPDSVPDAVGLDPNVEDLTPAESKVQKRNPMQNRLIYGFNKATADDFNEDKSIPEARGVKMAAAADLSEERRWNSGSEPAYKQIEQMEGSIPNKFAPANEREVDLSANPDNENPRSDISKSFTMTPKTTLETTVRTESGPTVMPTLELIVANTQRAVEATVMPTLDLILANTPKAVVATVDKQTETTSGSNANKKTGASVVRTFVSKTKEVKERIEVVNKFQIEKNGSSINEKDLIRISEGIPLLKALL